MTSVKRRLLARPDDTSEPSHIFERQRAFGMISTERLEFDLLGGLALELLDHDLAAPGLDHDAVAAPHRRRRRHDDDVAVAIRRQHGIAGNLQRVGTLVGHAGKRDFVPALANRKAAVVEIAAGPGLGEADQRYRLRRAIRFADQRYERLDADAG